MPPLSRSPAGDPRAHPPPGARSVAQNPRGAHAPAPPASAQRRSLRDAKGSRCFPDFPANQTVTGDIGSSLTTFTVRTNQEKPLAHSPALPFFCGHLPLPPTDYTEQIYLFFSPLISVSPSAPGQARFWISRWIPSKTNARVCMLRKKQNLGWFFF